MPSTTMEVSHYGQRSIDQVALHVLQLGVMLLVDRCLHRFGLIHIRSHAASHCCCLQFYTVFLYVRPGSCFWWLQLQHWSGLTGVCGAAVSHRVAHRLSRLLFGSIRLQLYLVEVFLEPSLAVVEW